MKMDVFDILMLSIIGLITYAGIIEINKEVLNKK